MKFEILPAWPYGLTSTLLFYLPHCPRIVHRQINLKMPILRRGSPCCYERLWTKSQPSFSTQRIPGGRARLVPVVMLHQVVCSFWCEEIHAEKVDGTWTSFTPRKRQKCEP